jgi:hypothetical protein
MSGLWSGSPGLWSGNPGLWGGYTGLSGGGGLWGAFGGFSPATLFAMGEQGYWLDPSDFSTMFQDSAGTTPVTAVGQNVGLILDKSRGLTPVNIATFNFDTGVDGFDGGAGGSVASVSGELQLSTTQPNSFAFRDLATVAGLTYRAKARLRRVSGTGGVFFRASTPTFGNIVSASSVTNSDMVDVVVYYVATTTLSKFYIQQSSSGGNSVFAIDDWTIDEVPGNHFIQSSLASRPVLQQDTAGNYFLLFDGSDDFLVSAATINPGAVDKVQVFAGVRKLSDAAIGMVVEASANGASGNAFQLRAPGSAASNYLFGSSGTSSQTVTPAGFAAPITNVLTGLADISGDSVIMRVNGAQAAINTSDQGTSNYLTYLHYIGRRAGTSLPFNGRIYQLVTRFGPNLTADVITQSEAFVAQRTGFTAPDIQGVPTIS